MKYNDAERFFTILANHCEYDKQYHIFDLASILVNSVDKTKPEKYYINKIYRYLSILRWQHRLWCFIRPEDNFDKIKCYKCADQTVIHNYAGDKV